MKSYFKKEVRARLHRIITLDELRHILWLGGGMDGIAHGTEEEYQAEEIRLAKKYGLNVR